MGFYIDTYCRQNKVSSVFQNTETKCGNLKKFKNYIHVVLFTQQTYHNRMRKSITTKRIFLINILQH